MILINYYSAEQIKAMLHISTKTLRLLRQYGLIKARKVGRSWRTSEKEFQEFLDKTVGTDLSTEQNIKNFAEKEKGITLSDAQEKKYNKEIITQYYDI